MLAINMDDVINVLNSCKPYLIALGIALALAIIVTVACMKLKKPVKKLVRKEAWIAFLMAAVVIINLICFIPMSSMISLAMGMVRSQRRPQMRQQHSVRISRTKVLYY